MATWLWIVIIVVIVAIVLAAVMAARRRRTMALRQRFGTEYDRALESRDGQRAAEADLRDRSESVPGSTSSRFPRPPACATQANGARPSTASLISRKRRPLLPTTS